jgi:hypothetical protein
MANLTSLKTISPEVRAQMASAKTLNNLKDVRHESRTAELQQTKNNVLTASRIDNLRNDAKNLALKRIFLVCIPANIIFE